MSYIKEFKSPTLYSRLMIELHDDLYHLICQIDLSLCIRLRLGNKRINEACSNAFTKYKKVRLETKQLIYDKINKLEQDDVLEIAKYVHIMYRDRFKYECKKWVDMWWNLKNSNDVEIFLKRIITNLSSWIETETADKKRIWSKERVKVLISQPGFKARVLNECKRLFADVY